MTNFRAVTIMSEATAPAGNCTRAPSENERVAAAAGVTLWLTVSAAGAFSVEVYGVRGVLGLIKLAGGVGVGAGAGWSDGRRTFWSAGGKLTALPDEGAADDLADAVGGV